MFRKIGKVKIFGKDWRNRFLDDIKKKLDSVRDLYSFLLTSEHLKLILSSLLYPFLYGAETWSVALIKEHIFRMLKMMVLRIGLSRKERKQQ
jgi:hypothetical protein